MPGTNLTRQEAEAREQIITTASYDISLDLTASETVFPSTTILKFSCSQPGASTFVDLIAPQVRRVVLNGRELDPQEVYADSRITLVDLEAENTLMVEAECEYSHTGEGLHRFTDPADNRSYTYSQCEVADARRIFACFEQPDLKARFTFHLVTDADWTAISNQPTPEPQITGDVARWDFAQTPIMSTYLVAVIAGPYTQWRDSFASMDGRSIPLGLFVRESMAQYVDPENIFDVTKRGFEFFEKSFRLAYPYEKYDQIFAPQYNAGAMENIGAVTLTESYVFRSKPLEAEIAARANTITHEQAHMWFGDLVTMKWWNDLWLNESFAEFMAHYACVNNTQWTNGWTDFNATRKLVGYAQDQLPTTHPIMADIHDLADVLVNFDMITYAKGASVLKQLVAWVGEEAFLTGVHNYLVKYAESNATLVDFLSEIEAASGQDLHPWSTMWLEEAGVTTLRPVVEEKGDGTYAQVSIAQEVPAVYGRFADIPHRDLPAISVTPSLRPHKIGLAGYDLDGESMVKHLSLSVVVEGALTQVEELSGAKVPDVLMVNEEDLTFATLRLDDRSSARLPGVLSKIDDPLTRALLWGSAWDSVRGGELPARQYLSLARGALIGETNSMTLLSVLARLRSATHLYVSPRVRAQSRQLTADWLRDMTEQAPPGTDRQLQFLKSFTSLACTDQHFDFLNDLFTGATQLPSLTMDTDLRWEILSALVAGGRLGPDEIDQELKLDPTMSGAEKAAGVRAAIPTIEAKRQAWEFGVLDDTITNATQREVLAGFSQVQDPSLLREFAGQYFSAIEHVWQTRTTHMRQNIVKAVYPVRLANDEHVDVLAMTDQWLDDLGARQPDLRRLVLANREEVICARLAVACDESFVDDPPTNGG
ncbi:MAG: aminopeptidase N [Propionibacteriaceae bacterium]|nr:aminopeptidase N [Propionibacteriaceae bacterium]